MVGLTMGLFAGFSIYFWTNWILGIDDGLLLYFCSVLFKVWYGV